MLIPVTESLRVGVIILILNPNYKINQVHLQKLIP